MAAKSALEQAHDQHLARLQDAALVNGLTFALRDQTTNTITAVTLQLPTQKTPPLYGVVTPHGFSLNLQDLTRLTGPEKNKLRDLFTTMQRA